MSYWYLAINNKSEGPLTADEIINRIRAAQVNPQTLAYTQGMSDWTPLGQIPQFHSLFKDESMAPPPVWGRRLHLAKAGRRRDGFYSRRRNDCWKRAGEGRNP
ncbi:MAG: hypothetical protein DMG05_14680, partial [Acidobacteria bacterium]